MPESVIPSDPHVAVVEQEGIRYEIILPNAGENHIQTTLAKTGIPYELAMLRNMRQRIRPDDLVLDVGANIGNHALYLAAVAQARVIAFEPNGALSATIGDSVRRNGLEERVSVRPIGLGRTAKRAQFTGEIPENIGTQELALGAGDTEAVALDSLEIADRIAAMRIAVAGMELQVLEGAAARISRDRPILYVKCRDEGVFLQIAAWAEARDYTCWDTFNATPTQLFLPAETLSVERQIARLNAQAIRQGYRLRSQQCADHREENATQAEALRLRAALDDARSEIGRLRASLDSGGERIATLEREKSEIEAREAVERDKSRARQYAAERQASVARAEVARLRAEFTDLRGYARDLEKKHVDILASETWRAMEPVRRLLRGVRRRPAPATFVPRLAPAQPDANSASRGMGVGGIADRLGSPPQPR